MMFGMNVEKLIGDKGKTATGKDAGVIELEPQARPI